MAPSKILKYSRENMEKALADVKNGIPVKTAANTYNVPKTTLYYKKIGKYKEDKSIGAPTILSAQEESALEIWMLHLAETGFPATKEQLIDSVEMILNKLKRQTKFNENRPGRHWYELFLKRHPMLSERITQNLTSGRSRVTEQNIRNWFEEISSHYVQYDYMDVANDATRVFNADEAAFFLTPKGNYVIAKKGQKSVYSFVANDEKECITTLVCGNAAGQIPPPMVLFAFQRIPPTICQKMPVNFALGKSDTGWMTAETFYEYITNVFHPWLVKNKIEFPVILYVDGHASHLTLPLSEFCKANKIILVALYPNSTHILQPMDVAIFHPLKLEWKRVVNQWKIENPGQKLKRETFAPLLDKTMKKVLRSDMFTNGFRRCGLVPLNVEGIDFSKIKHLKAQMVEPRKEVIHEDKKTPNIIIKYIENSIEKEAFDEFNKCFATGTWTGEEHYKKLFELWNTTKQNINNNNREAEKLGEVDDILIIDEHPAYLDQNGDQDYFDQLDDRDLLTEAQNIENYLNDTAQNINEHNEDFSKKEKINIIEIKYIRPPDSNRNQNKDDKEKIPESEELQGAQEKTETTPTENKTASLEEEKIDFMEESTKAITDRQLEIEKTPTKQKLEKVEEKTSLNDKYSLAEKMTEKKQEELGLRETQLIEAKPSETPIDHLNVESPFKKCLFWPETTPKNQKKKKQKEKIPTVATSDEWLRYHMKKQESKLAKEQEKEEKKRKRTEKMEGNRLKKQKKTEKKNRKEVLKDTVEIQDIKENEKIENTSQELKIPPKAEVGDFVIVKYDESYYPGLIQEKNQSEVKVSAMTASGPNLWKWPKPSDEIWYNVSNVMKLIEKPIPGHRETFRVPEMTKYSNFYSLD